MVTSDPYLNKFRVRPKVNSFKSYSNEMVHLILQDPDIQLINLSSLFCCWFEWSVLGKPITPLGP